MRPLIIASLFALTACGQPIKVNAPPPPADWLVCNALPAKPDLKPLPVFTMPDGVEVYLKADVDERDKHTSRYIIAIRGVWFECWNNAAKTRGYYGK